MFSRFFKLYKWYQIAQSVWNDPLPSLEILLRKNAVIHKLRTVEYKEVPQEIFLLDFMWPDFYWKLVSQSNWPSRSKFTVIWVPLTTPVKKVRFGLVSSFLRCLSVKHKHGTPITFEDMRDKRIMVCGPLRVIHKYREKF